ncbi:alkali metal cation/H+ antiporter Nha1 C terminus-domain-containing protein [Annulohypoxylon truncatum]|uniref:alkali metal cation/H+ antiporter Nha1 C terminus-domain-containing protein n=1 Tax=Annulohypoxylon truncatum TaxID=327061 RepID=UPI00200848BB|nr:alkali metal cation/H+ antiporter Nha1 C terminus-domain-containing protein [Annulohypoxylon truncatum]KAI1212163.1 alkali metal cation/H+ antiporter Nha1 C terminus-domain-containing protein [Annulohypoxylon truncatum]
MAWDHLSITKPHLVYIILGGFTSLFMLCSSVIKERMYIGEATIATLCGVIFGPHAANLINPDSWGNVDETTLEFSRIVLVVQCFAVGVELPKYYMEKHWKSVVFLLIPVMTFGWLITSLIVWWLFPVLTWLESLVVAACVTATDPVLASSVVGKGKFAKRVPKHLRDVLSAESGCNDGMAFPFIYLSLYLLQENLDAKQTTYHWLVYTVLYECIFGAFYGFMIGYIARHGIKFAEKHDLIDRESFLVFYFTLALFCAGSGSILGVDDLLVGFAAGVGFSNDGWFSEKTEESHVSNVIDLLLNLAYFVFLGTIIPWEQYNNYEIGLSAWRLTVMAIFVILFRRIPIMMLLKPVIPDIKTWREALFAGHFGPIGVGAIFVALLARAELESEHSIPEAELPEPGAKFYNVIVLVWPIVTFMVVASILVHGSSVAVFTLGKRINTLSITMSFTTAPEDGPAWMSRLPRISSQSRSQARTMSDTDFEEIKSPDFPPGTLGPVGLPGQFLRRQREEDNPSRAGSRASSLSGRRRSRKKWDDGIGPGGPVSQSAIFPQRKSTSEITEPMSPSDSVPPMSPRQESPSSPSEETPEKDSEKDTEKTLDVAREHEAEREATRERPRRRQQHEELEVYDEGDHIVIEDQEGQVLAVQETGQQPTKNLHEVKEKAKAEVQKPGWTYDSLKKSIGKWREEESQKRKEKTKTQRKHEPARAYQFGNTIIVEDEDGEVVRKYDLPNDGKDYVATSLKYMGMGGLVKPSDKSEPQTGESSTQASGARPPAARTRTGVWPGFNRGGAAEQRRRDATSPTGRRSEDDRGIRFTIGGVGRRMNKDDFLNEVQKLDARTRREVVDQSSATPAVKSIATEGPETNTPPVEQPLAHPHISVTQASTSTRDTSKSPTRPEPARGRSTTVGSTVGAEAPSDAPETAAERRRRLAAFASVREDNDTGETPAERRRREAALGVDSGAADDSDSDDDDTPRVPPARRGIRFADSPPNKG